MTLITLEVPDELVPQLNKLNKELPQLLSLAVSLYDAESTLTGGLADSKTLNDVLDFLISSPSAEDILNYKVPVQVQHRLEQLLEKNREGTLSSAEEAELTSFQQLNHFIILLKARSRKQLTY